MVQLTLPQGSKPTTGKVYKAAPGSKDVKTYKVYRYDPEVDADPRWDVYEVPTGDHGPMLLDALIHIKNTIDPTLSFRRSCREGICGSCSMNIDGRNTLACTKGWDECSSHNITIAPLPHQPVVKDLVTDLSLFYAQYDSIQPYLQSDEPDPEKERLQTPAERESWTACMSAFCAPAARPRAPATGGTRKNISARRRCCNPIAGFPTAATTPPRNVSTIWKTRSNCIAATRS